jgi:hypothetical protein
MARPRSPDAWLWQGQVRGQAITTQPEIAVVRPPALVDRPPARDDTMHHGAARRAGEVDINFFQILPLRRLQEQLRVRHRHAHRPCLKKEGRWKFNLSVNGWTPTDISAGRDRKASPRIRSNQPEGQTVKVTAAVSRGKERPPGTEPLDLEAPRAGANAGAAGSHGHLPHRSARHPGRHAPQPIVLGHEGAGVVEALGAGVRGFEPGDHVILSGSSCGRCPSCLANRPTYCDLAMPLCFGGKRLDGSTALKCGEDSVHSHFFGQSSFATHTPWCPNAPP